ncbi:MAG: hypothetical protein R3F34_01405 [Planctomycetota bacterium]
MGWAVATDIGYGRGGTSIVVSWLHGDAAPSEFDANLWCLDVSNGATIWEDTNTSPTCRTRGRRRTGLLTSTMRRVELSAAGPRRSCTSRPGSRTTLADEVLTSTHLVADGTPLSEDFDEDRMPTATDATAACGSDRRRARSRPGRTTSHRRSAPVVGVRLDVLGTPRRSRSARRRSSTTSLGSEHDATLSPDGRFVAIEQRTATGWRLSVVDAATGSTVHTDDDFSSAGKCVG